jgi:hypothetical protein
MFKISVISACFFQKKCYTGFVKRTEPLQGRVKFPIGGKVRKRESAGFGEIPKPTV